MQAHELAVGVPTLLVRQNLEPAVPALSTQPHHAPARGYLVVVDDALRVTGVIPVESVLRVQRPA